MALSKSEREAKLQRLAELEVLRHRRLGQAHGGHDLPDADMGEHDRRLSAPSTRCSTRR